MFVLPIGFPVITNNPIGICNWGSLSVGWSNFSMKSIVKSLEQTILQIHISDWIYTIWEWNTSWYLTISLSPVMLNSLHVPLVNDNNNFFMLWFINDSEKIIISLVDKDFFVFWEENIHRLDIPVNQMRIKTFLWKLRWFAVVKSSDSL